MTEQEAFEYLQHTIAMMKLQAKLDGKEENIVENTVYLAIDILLKKCIRVERENAQLKLSFLNAKGEK